MSRDNIDHSLYKLVGYPVLATQKIRDVLDQAGQRISHADNKFWRTFTNASLPPGWPSMATRPTGQLSTGFNSSTPTNTSGVGTYMPQLHFNPH